MKRMFLLLVAIVAVLAACGEATDVASPPAASDADVTTTQSAEPTETTPETADDGVVGPIEASAAEALCVDTFDAWQSQDGQALLGLALPDAAAQIEAHFGLLGALRSGGSDCFFMEILAETDGELGAVGDVAMGMLNGSPVVESVTWRSPDAFDLDADFTARVDAAPLVVPFGGESDGVLPDEDSLGAIEASVAEALCVDTFNAWQNEDGQALLGLALPDAAAQIEGHFGLLGALRSGGTDCFFMEILAETDGELGAVGDVTMGTLNGSPVVQSVIWRGPADLDVDASFAARVDAAPLVVPFGGESDGVLPDDEAAASDPRLSEDDFTEEELTQYRIDCIYGDGITYFGTPFTADWDLDYDVDACATLLQIDLGPNYGLGNSYAQAPVEFLDIDCYNGDNIACAELISRQLENPNVSANGTIASIEGFSEAQIVELQVGCIYYGGLSWIEGTTVSGCAELRLLGFGPNDNYGLGNSYSQMPDTAIEEACVGGGDEIACAEGYVRGFINVGD